MSRPSAPAPSATQALASACVAQDQSAPAHRLESSEPFATSIIALHRQRRGSVAFLCVFLGALCVKGFSVLLAVAPSAQPRTPAPRQSPPTPHPAPAPPTAEPRPHAASATA